MSQICSQIEAVYRSNSRAEVTETLSAIVIDACVSVTMTPERLAMEMMMLVTILHGNMGMEVGKSVYNKVHLFILCMENSVLLFFFFF
jgi:nucleolar MIF4G domain-containing protein 1